MGRMAGWLAHVRAYVYSYPCKMGSYRRLTHTYTKTHIQKQWNEFLAGPGEEQKIVRPRQIYKGHAERPYVDAAERVAPAPGYDEKEGVPRPRL